jgi:hypothetical protein
VERGTGSKTRYLYGRHEAGLGTTPTFTSLPYQLLRRTFAAGRRAAAHQERENFCDSLDLLEG